MMADMLAAGLNPYLGGFSQAPALVEQQVVRWFIELLGFPPSASGVLTLGGSMANVLALAVARNACAGFDVRELGVCRTDCRLMFYTSTETHTCITKAIELLGLGRNSLRRIAIKSDFRIDMRALRSAITADRQTGFKPICVI